MICFLNFSFSGFSFSFSFFDFFFDAVFLKNHDFLPPSHPLFFLGADVWGVFVFFSVADGRVNKIKNKNKSLGV